MDYSREEVTVDALRAFLTENDYDVKGVRKAELVETIKNDGLEERFEEYLGLEEDKEKLSDSKLEQKSVPDRGTKEWNDYVLSLFTDDERVSYTTPEGRKIDAVRADGLRRVGELVLGEVLFSGPVNHNLDYSGPKGMPAAQVTYKIVVKSAGSDKVREYLSLGDVSYLNTENAFLAFALLTAETRAKGRAWREALGVKTYAIEEFAGKKDTAAAVEEVSTADWKEQAISTSQQRTIKNISGKLNVDVLKLLNSTCKRDGNVVKELKYEPSRAHRYDGLDDEALTNKSAASIIQFLNQMQQGTLKIDESLLLRD